MTSHLTKNSLKTLDIIGFSDLAFDETFDASRYEVIFVKEESLKTCKIYRKTIKKHPKLDALTELMAGFEPATSSLPIIRHLRATECFAVISNNSSKGSFFFLIAPSLEGKTRMSEMRLAYRTSLLIGNVKEVFWYE